VGNGGEDVDLTQDRPGQVELAWSAVQAYEKHTSAAARAGDRR
jgi:hypothetical protein